MSDAALEGPVKRFARIGLTLLLAMLAYNAFHDDLGTVPLISDIDLAVHEFGHMLFMPFGIPVLGRTMVILGGSLTQVVFPLIFAGYFLQRREDGRRRDGYAATVCLWWAAINMLGVAIYMNDARARELTLINGLTGQESDGHDWYNLFSIWGVLNRDTIIAGRMRALAKFVCVGSVLGGFWLAWAGDDRAQGLLERKGVNTPAIPGGS